MSNFIIFKKLLIACLLFVVVIVLPEPLRAVEPKSVIRTESSRIVGRLQFSEDDSKLLVCMLDGVLQLYDLDSGKECWRYQHDRRYVLDAVYSRDNKTILCCGSSDVLNSRGWPTGFLMRLDPKTGQVISEFKDPEFINAFAESPDGMQIAVTYWTQSARIRSGQDWAELHRVRQDQLPILCLDFSDDGRYLSLGGNGTDGDGAMMLLETKDFPKLPGQKDVAGFVMDMEILDQQGVYLTATTKELTAWKIDSGKKLWSADDSFLKSLDVSPDRKLVAAGGYDLTIREIRSGKRVGHISEPDYTFLCVAFSHDGLLVAGGCHDCRIRIWSVADLKAAD